MSKKCAKCGSIKELEYFYKNTQQSDGYHCYCKECSYRMSRDRYKDNIENHDWKLEHALKASKARASKKGLENTLTFEQIKELYPIDNKCPILGVELKWGFPKDTSPSLDRIDTSKGYTFENCQIISNRANRIKSDSTIEELQAILNYLKETNLV